MLGSVRDGVLYKFKKQPENLNWSEVQQTSCISVDCMFIEGRIKSGAYVDVGKWGWVFL